MSKTLSIRQTQHLPVMDLENLATLNLLLPVEYTQDKMQANCMLLNIVRDSISKCFQDIMQR